MTTEEGDDKGTSNESSEGSDEPRKVQSSPRPT